MIKLSNYSLLKKDGGLTIYFDKVVDEAYDALLDVLNLEFSSFDVKKSITSETFRSVFSSTIAKLEEEQEESLVKRGRRKIYQLLGITENKVVCSWFDVIRYKLMNFISSLKEFLVCFFCALFDLNTSECRYGRATCYYEMIKTHLKEKIPTKRMFQKALKWYTEWKKSVSSWVNAKAEEAEHRVWEKLHQLVKDELRQLEPQLAMC